MDSKNAKKIDYISSVLLGQKRSVKYEVDGTTCDFDSDSVNEDVQGSSDEEGIMIIVKELSTETTDAKREVLKKVLDCFDSRFLKDLNPNYHLPYVNYFLTHSLPKQMLALDASQPWMIYWLVNSHYVLNNGELDGELKAKVMRKIILQNGPVGETFGPFAGGMLQYPHLAANYASILSLVLCEDEEITKKIDKTSIYEWLLTLKLPDGSFQTSENCGETDTRGIYCALSIASLLNVLSKELLENCLQFLISCQTFEGGFGGRPYEEAHGGYTFCAVASLVIIIQFLYGNTRKLGDFVDVDMLIRWTSARQENEIYGLSGRNNKLVDGCYSFWVGGVGSILEAYGYCNPIDKQKLRSYILQCCQSDESPGFRDKPGMRADFYHTNYVLLGLCCCDFTMECTAVDKNPLDIQAKQTADDIQNRDRILPVNPVYGLPCEAISIFTSWTV